MPITTFDETLQVNQNTINFLHNNIIKEIALKRALVEDEQIMQIADCINSSVFKDEIIQQLLTNLCDLNHIEICDWNIGNLLARLHTQTFIDCFHKFHNKFYLYNSPGFVWAVGEHNSKNIELISFLYKVIQKSRNSDAWWQAAFSLETLIGINPITLLKASLKQDGFCKLSQCLESIYDKRSVISILLQATNNSIRNNIYPMIKSTLLSTNSKKVLANCIWLTGRLKLIDKEIYCKIEDLLNKTTDYEIIHAILYALNENSLPRSVSLIEKQLYSTNPKIRKLCIKCIPNLVMTQPTKLLEQLLVDEKDPTVLAEISSALYKTKNYLKLQNTLIEKKCLENETGLIIDESDKWYGDPAIYNRFSEAEDPENLCFDIISKYIEIDNRQITNPVDLATGTGKILKQIVHTMEYNGVAYGIDSSHKMVDFLRKNLNRQKSYVRNVKLLNGTIENTKLQNKSNFIISSFGFPSKISNKELCIRELHSVYNMLSENGIFTTIGWDELFNDELSEMWFKHLQDNIVAGSFEEWGSKKSQAITSPRNCNLTWLKKGLLIPLQFNELSESVFVMGHLFGRDAAKEVLKNKKTEWNMSIGITYNTKEEIGKILRELNEGN